MNEQELKPVETPLSERAAAFAARLRRIHIPVTPVSAAAFLIVTLLAIGAAVLPGLTLTTITPETPIVRADGQLTIRLIDEHNGRVGVRVTDRDAAFGPEADNRWRRAAENLPDGLEPASPIYELRFRGGKTEIELTTLEGAADLYRWNRQAQAWEFSPVTRDSANGSLVSPAFKGPFALLQPAADAPLIGASMKDDAILDPALDGLLDFVVIDDSELSDDTNRAALTSASDLTRFARAHYEDSDVFKALTAEGAAREAHLSAIEALAADAAADGIALDFSAIGDAPDGLEAFIADVRDRLQPTDALAVQLPAPTQTDDGWTNGGYAWASIGETADIIIVTLPGGPQDLTPGGSADSFLNALTGEVSRTKLYIQLSAMSVDEWAGQLIPIPNDYAIEPLGVVDIAPEQVSALQTTGVGDSLQFELVGPATAVGQDEASGMYYYEAFAGGGTHWVWLMTSAALRRQLDWIGAYRPAGILVEGLAGSHLPETTVTALEEFLADTPSSLDDSIALQWTVSDQSGRTIDERITELGESLVWTPEQPGEFVISANLAGLGRSERGALALIVGGETVGVAPSQEGVVVGSPDVSGAQASGSGVAIPTDMPPPVVPAGNQGNFELGGQVNHVIRNAGAMREAGMDWVKFQLVWGPGTEATAAWDVIERGRAEGFKVLLSIAGQSKYPGSIDHDEFNDFLRRVAYYGPEAIEVWNEPNLDFEWPRGRIDGAAYTREMLAPAYNAIKSINPNIMVISAAPAPTGAFYGDGGCSPQGYGCDDWLFLQQMAEAGAANYMDCVGAHFNSGATSPTWNTGHPADPGFQHYSWYYGGMLQLYGGTFGRKVCFTELGFLSGQGLGSVPDRFSWASNTSVADQATWLAEAAQLSRESDQVRLMIVWNVDFTFWGDDPMAGYAIIRPDGSCPACPTLGAVMP